MINPHQYLLSIPASIFQAGVETPYRITVPEHSSVYLKAQRNSKLTAMNTNHPSPTLTPPIEPPRTGTTFQPNDLHIGKLIRVTRLEISG
ncbi:hypothetical protein DSO57_1002366 [Entomophthora muscae]|uniref:Uncharacterized protein n=1 Tax=Entomophthora muscae TaxID=34485 RepID=A0ACC2RNQ7_9FUNG|nr:hypothetical protein DSO57_1002366 [Entomophthora muscae]